MSIVSFKSSQIPLGSRFSRWLIIEKAPPRPASKGPRPQYLCRCECGKEQVVLGQNLLNGASRSCGCFKRERDGAARRARIHISLGQRFGRWIVVGDLERHRRSTCLCRCDCGAEEQVLAQNLLNGTSQSCGCLKAAVNARLQTRHGEHDSRLYRIWRGMRQRCGNPNIPEYRNYGGRGIRTCPEWESYPNFRAWAILAGYEEELTIERKNVDGNYEPDNCAWIPLSSQGANRRNNIRVTAWGETRCLSEWARDPRAVVSRASIDQRIKRGWKPEAAITTPL